LAPGGKGIACIEGSGERMTQVVSIESAMVGFYVPILLGWLYARGRKDVNTKTIAQLLIRIFLPALLFVSIYEKKATDFTISVLAALAVVTCAVTARLLLREPEFVLSSMYTNAGYLPIPLAYSLWGSGGVAYVALYILGNNTTSNVIAPLIAGRSLRRSLKYIVYFPPLYAIVAALILGNLRVDVPEPVMYVAERLGLVAPPLALVLLGMEFASARVEIRSALKVGLLRAVVMPPVLIVGGMLAGFTGLSLHVLVLESIMPPAVSNVVLAADLGMNSKHVASIVLTLTAVSTLVFIPLFFAAHTLGLLSNLFG